jgi:hypothetical protein
MENKRIIKELESEQFRVVSELKRLQTALSDHTEVSMWHLHYTEANVIVLRVKFLHPC